MAIITTHAKKRLKQRLGLPKKALEKHVDSVLQEGKKHCDAKGRARKWMDKMYLSYEAANNMRVHGQFLYVFNSQTLITVVPVPRWLLGGF